MKKGYKIAIAVGAAGLAFLIWKKWDDLFPPNPNDKTDDKTPALPSDKANAPASTEKGLNGGPSDYELAVARLQELLGVAVDMKPAMQTNGKLDYMYSVSDEALNATKAMQENYPNLKKYGKGVVTPNNVNWYVEQLQNHWTPRELTPYRRIGETLRLAQKGWFKSRAELPFVVGTGGTGYKLTGGYVNVPAVTEYEVVNWSWQNATLYIRVKINDVPRVLQVFGEKLKHLSKDKVFKIY